MTGLETDLYSNPSPLTWSFWKYPWVNPSPGTCKIRVRSTDGKGRVEKRSPQGTFPEGATGQETLKVTVA